MKKEFVQTLKGFRDFLPAEAKKRQYAIRTLQEAFELFGFEPLETPALEYEEILTGKYGEEGEKLMYRFVDNGGRKVALRYDQTVPLARVIAQYSNDLPIVFKRYQMQPVWRGENTQKGRYREFMQCDIDIVGTQGSIADAEVVGAALTSMKKLGFQNYTMRINDRRIFEELNLTLNDIRALDKFDKEGSDPFINELLNKGFSLNLAKETFSSIVNFIKPQAIEKLFSKLRDMGYTEGRDKDFFFDPTLARGLDYYTSYIFELALPSYGNLSLGGGGRYDNLIGIFANKDVPAVGFAFGFDRLIEAMEDLRLFPKSLSYSPSDVVISAAGLSPEVKSYTLEVTTMLRNNDINAETFFLDEQKNTPDSISNPIDYFNKYDKALEEKQYKYAIQKKIPYTIIISSANPADEIILKDIETRTYQKLSREKLIDFFKSK